MKPLVSVITVVYNDAAHILQTMESVFSQTYSEKEYIIIDGGSTDGTVDIIESRETLLSVFVSDNDQGVYDAMNKGVAYARGEWIIFMNSGDLFDNPFVLSNIFNSYDDRGEALIYGDTILVNSSTGDNRLTQALDNNGERRYMPAFHQSILTRAQELKSYPYSLKYRLISDMVFYYNLYKRNPRRYYYPGVISRYDLSGISSVNLRKRAEEYFTFYWGEKDFRFFFWLLVFIKRTILRQS